jgi:hypothetical protein
MSAAAKPTGPTAPEISGEFELAGYLAAYLKSPEPRVLMILGPPGAGKSSLLRALVPRVPGRKYFLAYQSPEPSPATAANPAGGPPQVPMLLVDPQLERSPGPRTPDQRFGSSLLAFGAQGPETPSEAPNEIMDATRRLVEAGSGSIFVDSWDHGSEKYFRSQAPGAECVRTFIAPASSLLSMRSAALSTPTHLILGFTPEAGEPLVSLSDAVVDLRGEEHPEGRLRVASVPKIRESSAPARSHLYTLAGGVFRSMPALPAGFRPPFAAPAEDPEGPDGEGWPGSTSFARVFGRLRSGGVTIIGLSAGCPETVPQALSLPLVAHALLHGGRVVWIPAPAIRPSQVVAGLRPFVPADLLRERLRVLSAGGDDPSLGDLSSIVLALHPPATSPGTSRGDWAADSANRIFPDAYRFMQEASGPGPVLMVASFEGMWAAARAMGTPIAESLVPVEMGFYTRLANAHILGIGLATDPVMPQVQSVVDTLIQLEMVHGRPVLFGVRPKTTPQLLDWSTEDGSYSLVASE